MIKINETYTNESGTLCPIKFDELPFVPQHIFYTKNVPRGGVRGRHAHLKCEQVLICIRGLINVVMYDGFTHKTLSLRNEQCAYLPPMVWSQQHFDEDNSILLVLSSHPYDENDYIRDIEIYKQLIMEKSND